MLSFGRDQICWTISALCTTCWLDHGCKTQGVWKKNRSFKVLPASRCEQTRRLLHSIGQGETEIKLRSQHFLCWRPRSVLSRNLVYSLEMIKKKRKEVPPCLASFIWVLFSSKQIEANHQQEKKNPFMICSSWQQKRAVLSMMEK